MFLNMMRARGGAGFRGLWTRRSADWVTASVVVLGLFACAASDPNSPGVDVWGSFFFVSEGQAMSRDDVGMVMQCPSHRHGSWDEASEKLRRIIADRPPGATSSIWVCRSRQIETVQRFAPLVDCVIVNPFAVSSETAPEDTDAIWPGADHPLLNQLRQVCEAAGDARVLACINGSGEGYFGDRSPSLDELAWMTLSAVGAGCEGVVWRHRPAGNAVGRRLAMLEKRIGRYGAELVDCEPVDWVNVDGDGWATALASDDRLLVVVVNPALMNRRGGEGDIVLPLSVPPLRGRLGLSLPAGTAIEDGRSLSGRAVEVHQGPTLTVSYRVCGAGELFVFPLSHPSTNTSAPSSPAKEIEDVSRHRS